MILTEVWWWCSVLKGCECSERAPKPPGSPVLNAWGVLSFTQPAPWHTELVLRDHTAVLNAALFLHTLPTRFCLSLHSQQFVNIPCLFSVIDSMNWFYFSMGGGQFLFLLVAWMSVILLLSLKLEFIFYKPEWNVFVFQVIISILLGCRLRLMKWAHQTVLCANEAVQAGWLAASCLLL